MCAPETILCPRAEMTSGYQIMSPSASYFCEDDIADQMVLEGWNPNEDSFLEEIGNDGSSRGNEDLQSNVVIEEQDQLPNLTTNDAVVMIESDKDQSRNGALDMIGYYCDTNDMQSDTGVEETAVDDNRKDTSAVRTPRTRSGTRLGRSIGKQIRVLDGVLNKNPLKKKNRKSKGSKKSGKRYKLSKDKVSWGSRVRELHPKTQLLQAASTIEKLFETVAVDDPVYQRIAKIIINTVHQNKENPSDYIIDLTLDEQQHGCLNEECNCKLYTKERYITNGFYISSFPSVHFDNSRVKTISEYIEKSDLSNKINFGSEKDVHRYGLNWSDLKSQENIQYVDALLNLLEKEVSNFLENGIANETGSPEAFLGQYTGTRDAALILSLPGGGAQDGHTDYEGQEDGVSVLLALQENTSLDIVLGSHADNEKVSPFSNVPIPTFHYIVFHGLLCHRGVGYSEYNLRLHAYFDFVGNKRTRNKVYNRVYESTPRRKRISRVLPQRKLMRASDE